MVTSTYFLTGTSRGIGLEYVRQILKSEPGAHVIATARSVGKSTDLQELHKKHPSNLDLLDLEVTDNEGIKRVATEISAKYPNGIDYLILNAGIAGPETFQETSPEQFAYILAVNTIAPFAIIKELLPLVRKGEIKVIVAITSRAGSLAITPTAALKQLAYRTSKTALNQVMVSFAKELAPEKITCVPLHPGFVDTDMANDAIRAIVAKTPLSPEESVATQLKVIHGLKFEDSGKFYCYDGSIIPW